MPGLMLTPGLWLVWMAFYGLGRLVRWLVVMTYRVCRWLFWELVALIDHGVLWLRYRRRPPHEHGNVVPLRRRS